MHSTAAVPSPSLQTRPGRCGTQEPGARRSKQHSAAVVSWTRAGCAGEETHRCCSGGIPCFSSTLSLIFVTCSRPSALCNRNERGEAGWVGGGGGGGGVAAAAAPPPTTIMVKKGTFGAKRRPFRCHLHGPVSLHRHEKPSEGGVACHVCT